ncbi:MAG: bacterial transcriptional activator domain-containing protein, partial [Verrucomicrobia bacterium]|nr:bacterial transcriptional activator domain-containing protein [Verrucomicrobiota bacterium]
MKFTSYLCLFLLTSSTIYCGSPLSITKRVQAHLTIGDPQSAKAEVELLLQSDPDNLELLRLQIHCLAALQDTAPLLRSWRQYCQIKKGEYDRPLMEEVSWSIIRKASCSTSPVIRFEGMLSAFFSNDAKGIPIC